MASKKDKGIIMEKSNHRQVNLNIMYKIALRFVSTYRLAYLSNVECDFGIIFTKHVGYYWCIELE